jgi:hypothetical protein
MNTEKAQMVVMSHLSDAQEMAAIHCPHTSDSHINFAKYIILNCKGDLNQEIEPDTLWAEFMKTKFYKG